MEDLEREFFTRRFAETDRVQEALRRGAAGFVRKPYTVERLALAMKEALDDSGRL